MGMSAADCDWDQGAFEAWAEEAERLDSEPARETPADIDRSGA